MPAPDLHNADASPPKIIKRRSKIGMFHARKQLDEEEAEEVLKLIKSRL